jgi:hypothetical protein
MDTQGWPTDGQVLGLRLLCGCEGAVAAVVAGGPRSGQPWGQPGPQHMTWTVAFTAAKLDNSASNEVVLDPAASRQLDDVKGSKLPNAGFGQELLRRVLHILLAVSAENDVTMMVSARCSSPRAPLPPCCSHPAGSHWVPGVQLACNAPGCPKRRPGTTGPSHWTAPLQGGDKEQPYT